MRVYLRGFRSSVPWLKLERWWYRQKGDTIRAAIADGQLLVRDAKDSRRKIAEIDKRKQIPMTREKDEHAS